MASSGRQIPDLGGELRQAAGQMTAPGGKRLRAGLVYAAWQASGGAAGAGHSDDGGLEPVVSFAAAIELLHAYSLVHDDLPCMDNAETRRAMPTVHRRFGEATAVLCGDVLQAMAFAELSRYADPAVLRRCAQVAVDLVAGQACDLDIAARPQPATAAVIRRMAHFKTGQLFGLAGWLGAVLSGHEHADNCHSLGLQLGGCYQIIDDIIDAAAGETSANNLCSVAGEAQLREEVDAIFAATRRQVAFLPNPPPMSAYIDRLAGLYRHAC